MFDQVEEKGKKWELRDASYDDLRNVRCGCGCGSMRI